SGPGIRVDTGGYPGLEISPRYDSLLAKIVATGGDWVAASRRLAAALEEFSREGVSHNLDMLPAMVAAPEYGGCVWATSYIATHFSSLSDHRRGPSLLAANAAPTQERADQHASVHSIAVHAPMSGVISRIDATIGDVVGAGAPLLVVEAMKIEHPITAEQAMSIDVIDVAIGDVVSVDAFVVGGEPADADAVCHPAPDGDWSAEGAEIQRRRQWASKHGGPEKVRRQHDQGKLTARERVEAIADRDS